MGEIEGINFNNKYDGRDPNWPFIKTEDYTPKTLNGPSPPSSIGPDARVDRPPAPPIAKQSVP
ncbi:hypothetical protein TSMEX_006812 [Taenia solium]|eukprot:TsM_001090500 transcript=TsM_001090500 gene=TsM_001090500